MKVTSIKTKLLAILLPCILLSFMAISVASGYLAHRELSKSVDETAMAVGMDYANRVQAYIREALIQQEDFSALQQIRAPENQQQLIEGLAESKNRLKVLESSVFIYPDGNALRSDGTSVQLGDRDYFKKVLETKAPVVSELMISRTTGKTAFNIAVPVMDGGALKGVLTGSFAIDKLNELIKDLKFMDSGYGVVLDESGVIIAHARVPEMVGKLNLMQKEVNPEINAKEKELDDRLINLVKSSVETDQQIRGEYTFIDGVTRIATLTSIQLPGDRRWIVMVTAPAAEATSAVGSMLKTILLLSGGCLLLVILFIVIISNRIAKPIMLFRDECLKMAGGDLTEQEKRIFSQDEIGQADKGLREMRASLRSLIINVVSRSEQAAASSEELTAISQQSAEAANQVAASIAGIAEGADKQAASANYLAEVAQEIAVKTGQVSTASRKAADIAVATSHEAEQGRQIVERAETQMTEVGKGSLVVQAAVDELSRSSLEIDEIVTLISSIAGQTNLLALNAAIEAARAGEHGKGFAVVAEEIRKLAEESNQSAKQIGALILRNQQNIERAVEAMKSEATGIQTGIDLVHKTGDTFKSIIDTFVKLADEIEEISEAISRVSDGGQELVSSIREIDNISKSAAAESQMVSAATEEQSASMQEIASSSQELAAMAGELQAAVEKFKVY